MMRTYKYKNEKLIISFYEFITICQVFHQINIFTADFSGSMQHYDKVISTKSPDSELESTMPCGKFAI